MNLNFLNVLNDKSATVEAIAEEIMKMESKIQECEKAISSAKDRQKDIIRRRLCGEIISDQEIDREKEIVRVSQDEIEILNEGLAELNRRLDSKLVEYRQSESDSIPILQTTLAAAREELGRFLSREEGRIYGILCSFYSDALGIIESQYPALAKYPSLHPDSFGREFAEGYREVLEEINKKFEHLPSDLESSIIEKINWCGRFQVRDERKALFIKLREQE